MKNYFKSPFSQFKDKFEEEKGISKIGFRYISDNNKL
jgi:hypothetical protein